MQFCIICFLRSFGRSQHVNPEHWQQPPVSSDITTELEDLRRFALNSLATLLPILAIQSATTSLVLTLLIYTISLRLATNTCLLHDYPTLSRFLHVLPLLGISCVAGVKLVSNVQSPAFAVVGLLLGVLPLVAIAVHHGRRCIEASGTVLPVQMRHVPAHPTV